MKWTDVLRGDPLPWLLEVDPQNPAVRFFTLRDVLDRPADDPEVRRAAAAIMKSGPVAAILAAQHADGSWGEASGSLLHGYKSTVWQVYLLAELGAASTHRQVRRGCEYVLSRALAANNAFSMAEPPVPSKVVHCHNGDMLYAAFRLGFAADARVQAALRWQVQAINGNGDIRYYQSGTSGPGFACAVNQKQPCAWGAAKAMKALAAVPPDIHTPAVRLAIKTGAEFLLGRDPAKADYPYTERISTNWFKFGFPLSYTSDVLEVCGVLVDLGYGRDARLKNALQFILSKQDAHGCWTLEHTLNGKSLVNIEQKGRPSKWITLRALRVLKRSAQG